MKDINELFKLRDALVIVKDNKYANMITREFAVRDLQDVEKDIKECATGANKTK